jgi:nickel-dependent lactate racemase
MEMIKSSEIAKMKYVVQCYVSDKKGIVMSIADFTQDQLESAFQKACEFYNDVLPVPDNGRYQDYVL